MLARKACLAVLAVCSTTLLAQTSAPPTAEQIVANYIKTIGGIDKIEAVTTLRRTGKFHGGGGFEATVLEENKRPDLVRQEFTFGGMTGVTAWDGKTGWKIEPWQGKKDPEPLGEEEMKGIVEDSVFDGQLVHYKEKGSTIEYAGTEPVEGTDTYKLKVTLKNGDVQNYYMDEDYFVPIKIEIKRMIRGAEQETEISLGDYKAVNGWYLPHAVEQGRKGSQNRATVVYDRIEANTPMDDSIFQMPAAAPAGK